MFKKILFSVAALSVMFTAAQAQQYISLGPVIGFGHSSVTNGDYMSLNNVNTKTLFNPSFNAGISLIYAKHAHWGFGGAIVYSQEGYKKQFSNKTGDYNETNTAGYIRVPLRAYYFFGQYKQTIRPKLYAGPSFGLKIMDDIKLEANNATTGISTIFPPTFNSFDLGLQIGAGVNITLAKAMWLNVDLNYYQGVLDALKDSNSGNQTGSNLNQDLRLQVGLLFGLGGKTNKK